MRNNERIRALIKDDQLASFPQRHFFPATIFNNKALYCLIIILLLYTPHISQASNRNIINVDQALPTLINEGETMLESQSWYRAHTQNGSYTSAFNGDGSLLALTSKNNPVELWDTAKRQPISIFSGSELSHSEAFVDLSADGKYIAINIGDRIEIRKIENSLLAFSVPTVSGGSAAFSPNSQWFATAIDGKRLDLWDVAKKKRESSFIHHEKLISALGFSHDGSYLVSADKSGMFAVWNTDSKEMQYQYSNDNIPITTIQFNSTGDNFITIDTSGKINLWSVKNRELLHSFITPKKARSGKSAATFSPDGTMLMVSFNTSDDVSYLLSFSTFIGGEPLFVYKHNGHRINDIAYGQDSQSLLVSLNSKTIKVFNIPGRQYVDTFGGQILKANQTRVSPDGSLFATGTVDGDIQLWDAHKKILKYSLKGRNRSIEHISFSPDGQYIIAGDIHGAVTIWARNTNKRIFFIDAHKQGSALGALSPDNQFLATASTKSSIIKLWDIQTKEPIFKFIGHHGDITGLVYSPNGKFIASSSKDGTIKLWNMKNKSLEQSFIGSGKTVSFSSLVFSPDGRYLAGGTNQGASDKHVIEIWDAQELKHVRTLNMHDSAITTVRFSANGKQLATGSQNGMIKVWDVATGLSTHSFSNSKDEKVIHSVDFTKNGENILSVAQDGATDLWSLKYNKKSYTLLGGPRGTWVSENHLQHRFIRGDDGSLNIKTNSNSPPAPLAPQGLATEDKLLLTASRKTVKVSKEGGEFSITIKNIGDKPSFWLRARQLNSDTSSVTLLSNKLTRLNAGKRGVLNLQLIPHGISQLGSHKKVNLEMEVTTKAGSHFPIVIPLEFQFPATHIKTGINKLTINGP